MAKEIDLDALIEKEFDDLINLNEVDTSIKTWLDIGVYALNYICSKRLTGGIPVSRVSSIKGLTSTGKSLLIASIMKDPQIDYILVIETEGGGSSKELYDFAGVDTSKIRMLKASTFGNYKIKKKDSSIEEVPDGKFPKNKETSEYIYVEGITRMIKQFINIITFNNIKKTIFVVLDSLGNTQSVRELSGTQDMGARTKDIATFFRCFDNAFEKSNIAFMFSNKLYTNIGNQWQPYKESGGVNAEYNPSISIELWDTSDTDDVSDADMKAEKERRKTALGSSIKTIRAVVAKSRFGTELRRCNFLIDMAIGPAKYSGLFGLLKDFEVIKRVGGSSYYEIPGLWDKSFMRKDFINRLKENEEENIKKLQELLNKREEEIIVGKQELQISGDIDSFEIEGEIDEELNEEDAHDLKKEMIRDLEK